MDMDMGVRVLKEMQTGDVFSEESCVPVSSSLEASLCPHLWTVNGLITDPLTPIPSFLSPQIKIWFQNRRTKWKRKYTSELEIAAQQYYSAMGLVSPRPMVLGDRLWLFPNAGPFGHPSAPTSSHPLLFPPSHPAGSSSSSGPNNSSNSLSPFSHSQRQIIVQITFNLFQNKTKMLELRLYLCIIAQCSLMYILLTRKSKVVKKLHVFHIHHICFSFPPPFYVCMYVVCSKYNTFNVVFLLQPNPLAPQTSRYIHTLYLSSKSKQDLFVTNK